MSKILEEDTTDYISVKIVKHTKEDFSFKVMELAKELKISYLEAVQEMIEAKKIEVEIVAKLITTELS